MAQRGRRGLDADLRARGRVAGVHRLERRTVIVAGNDQDPRYPDADPPPDLPWLMVSRDGGRTWDESLAWTGDTDWCLDSLTASHGTIVLDARCATPDAASTYVVTP